MNILKVAKAELTKVPNITLFFGTLRELSRNAKHKD